MSDLVVTKEESKARGGVTMYLRNHSCRIQKKNLRLKTDPSGHAASHRHIKYLNRKA